MSPEIGRKLVHLLALLIPILYYFLPRGLSIFLLLLATGIFLTVDFLRLHINFFKALFIIIFGSLLRRKEFHSLTGGSYLMIAASLAIFIFEDRGVFMAAISFLAIGDTVAAIFGLTHGKTHLFGRKTLEGTIACFISCLAVVYILTKLPDLSFLFWVGFWGAVTATLVEALPIEVNDNVVIPIASGIAMQISKIFIR
uniref:Phosphatidate cytidylyltransferase n=1 Tax=candidate division WOR-3 bacterium TaxID=2052148 RepID=A0A7C3UVM9_UNCW3